MSAVMNTIGVAFAYAVLALFAQNAIFTRGLGVSRLIQLVGDERTSSWWFALLLCVTQTLVAPLAYFAGSQIVDLPYRAQLRPLLYLACVAVVCIFEHAILRAVKGPRSGLLIRILPIAAVNSGVLGTVLVERTQSFTLAQSIGFGLGSGLGYLLAVLLAHATGTSNVTEIMMATSSVVGVIIVVASTVKLNDINLYSSSLGLATMINALFNKKISRNALVWTLGIVGTFLSVIGIINYFTSFLTLLGVAIPPVAGIMVIDYFVLRRNRKALDASRETGTLPSKVENWNPVALVCWVVGFAVGESTSLLNIGIPGLNSLIIAGMLYWVIMKIVASSKKVEHVMFKETDQVL